MRLYLSFSKHLFHNYVCQVVKGNDPILASEGRKKKPRPKQNRCSMNCWKSALSELLNTWFLTRTVSLQLKYKKGRACLWASLWPILPIYLNSLMLS